MEVKWMGEAIDGFVQKKLLSGQGLHDVHSDWAFHFGAVEVTEPPVLRVAPKMLGPTVIQSKFFFLSKLCA